ncbi:MAG: hypothetical protein R3336_07130, partial [Phycisphaeraceae bacterium]|nr:hypothetical protein [Phycisphaeraceae bacterium]
MSLHVRQIQLTQFLGITPDRPLTLDDLDHPVVVIHGGQGAGKSTLARAVMHTLWPESALTGFGSVTFADPDQPEDRRRAELTGPDVHFPERPELGELPVDPRTLHWIRLHDLLPETPVEEKAFTDHILRLAAGGVDVAGAVKAIIDDTSGKREGVRNNATDLSRVEKELRQLRQKQNDVRQREREVDTLQHEIKSLQKQRERLDALKAIQTWQIRKRELEVAREALAQISPHDFSAVPDDIDAQLTEIREEITRLEQSLVQPRQERENAEEQLDQLDLAHPPDDTDVSRLRRAVQAFEDAARETDDARDTGRQARARLDDARALLADADLDPDAVLPAIDQPDALADFLRAHQAVTEARKSHETLNATFEPLDDSTGDNPESDDVPADNLLRAIGQLQTWLQAGATSTHASSSPAGLFFAAVALLGLGLTIAAGALAIWWALAGFLLITLIAGTGLLLSRSGPATATSVEPPTELLRQLGLTPPGSWNEETVREQIDQLRDRLKQSLAAESLERLADQRQDVQRRLEEAEADLRKRQAQLAETGCDVESLLKRDQPLVVLREILEAATRARVALSEAHARETTARERRDQAHADLATVMADL